MYEKNAVFHLCYEGQKCVHCVVVFQEARGYYEQTGIGPLPVVLFNGMPLEKDQLDPDELETVTMHRILETTAFFQRAVYLVSGSLTADFEGQRFAYIFVVSEVGDKMLITGFCSPLVIGL